MKSSQDRKFKCWAAVCGGCDGGPSNEHLLSKNLFPEGAVKVSGFPWCEGETKSIGINGLQRQILCRAHNSALSEVDVEAMKVVENFQRATSPRNSATLSVDIIDGKKLERWLLKTAINLSYEGILHIGVGMNGSVPGLPSPYLIDVAFGKLPFTHKMGAHFLIPEKNTLHKPNQIAVSPIFKDGHIGGFYFDLRSQAIFLNLFPSHTPPTLGTVAEKMHLQTPILDAKLVYRPLVVATESNGLQTSLIKFKW